MKKLYLLLILLFIPIFVLAESNIEIKSIELTEKSKYVEELETPSYEGLKLNFNLKFKKLDDYAKYKIVLKNNTDKAYEITDGESFNDGKFIKYEFIVNNTVLEANKELIIYIKVSYVKQLEDNLFVNNEYSENNNVSLELSNDEEDLINFIVNPNTNTGYIVLITITILISILVIILIKNKKVKMYILIILLMPITVYALEKIKIDIETHIEIERIDTFILVNKCAEDEIINDEEVIISEWKKEEYDYNPGMTFMDFLNSSLYNDLNDDKKRILNEALNFDIGNYLEYQSYGLIECIKEIDFPIYKANMTDEEYQEYQEQLTNAIEAEKTCRRNYSSSYHISQFDLINSSKIGLYYSLLQCPM